MKPHMPNAEIFVPDGVAVDEAIARSTHLVIACHQDDIEIMAYHGALQCFGREDKWFGAVTVTNGAGSPRDDLYADYTDEMMMKVRRLEQKKAAFVGEYGFQALLDYPSSAVKDTNNPDVRDDLTKIILAAGADIIYTHNLADKHDTHVSVALRTIQALRNIPEDQRPSKLYGCEVWRDLDWMTDEDKTAFDVAAHPSLATALLGVFDSQNCGGKRYDLASIGRRAAHATYHASHAVNAMDAINFGMDMTPLINDPSIDIAGYADAHIQRFAQEVNNRCSKFE